MIVFGTKHTRFINFVTMVLTTYDEGRSNKSENCFYLIERDKHNSYTKIHKNNINKLMKTVSYRKNSRFYHFFLKGNHTIQIIIGKKEDGKYY
jgi:hypothetical protein